MHKRVSSAVMAVMGLMFFGAFVGQDVRIHPEIAFADMPWGLILRYALAMTLGGALAGYLLAGLFGRRGLLGWFVAFVGGLLCALIAGVFGSVIGLVPDLLADGYQTADLVRAALGALVVPLSLIEAPILLPVLVGLLIAAHLLVKRSRTPLA